MKIFVDFITTLKPSRFIPGVGLNENYQMRLNAYILGSATLGLILLLSILNLAGRFGALIGGLLLFIVGRGAILIPLFCWLCTYILIRIQGEKLGQSNWSIRLGWGVALMIWSFLAMLNLIFGISRPDDVINGGGFAGYFLYPFLLNNPSSIFSFGVIGSFVIIFVIWLFGFFLFTGQKYTEFWAKTVFLIRNPRQIWEAVPDIFDLVKPDPKVSSIMEPMLSLEDGANVEKLMVIKPVDSADDSQTLEDSELAKSNFLDEVESILNRENINLHDVQEIESFSQIGVNETPDEDHIEVNSEDNSDENTETHYIKSNLTKSKNTDSWQMPDLKLLIENTETNSRPINIDENKAKIKSTFAAFGIDVEMTEAITGPTVSQYTFRPASGVKLSRISSLQNDLALALAAKSIRMELPIPGQSAASIEIPNPVKSMVRIKDLLKSPDYLTFSGHLPMAIGQDVSGKNIVFSLAKAPHLLVAGATGAGKSVWINSMLLSLLYKYSPAELQLILVDMKMVELNLYDGIPHLLTPVITESDKAINALKWSIFEMNRRYKMLRQYGKRNIADFNDFAISVPDVKPLPYTVFVIDELADLMMQAKSEVEPIVARLTAMSRAVGIHLVLGTQRPDTTVVTGLIKTNIPTRICFAVVTQIDSRVILDFGGGENLLGQGDGLLKSPVSLQPIRFQGAFVDEKEVKRVVDELATQSKYRPEMNNFDPDVVEPPAGSINVPGLKTAKKIDQSDGVLLYEKAKELVLEIGQCSPNIIAGNMDVDLKTAKYIIEELEGNGIVGPEVHGMVGREVLV